MPATASAEIQGNPDTALWLCEICEYVYDPAEGDPDGGVPTGTPFDDIPDDWVCPMCGARKKEFRLLKPGEEIPEDVFVDDDE